MKTEKMNKVRFPLLLVLCGCCAIAVAAALWYPPLWQASYAPLSDAPFRQQTEDVINLNTAGLEELKLLPGIGEERAWAVVDYRKEHGPFTSAEELTNVRGIGPKIMQDVRAYVCV